MADQLQQQDQGCGPELARADGSGTFLKAAIAIAEKLDGCLRFDEPNITEDVLEETAREAVTKLRELAEYQKAVEAWASEGMKIANTGAPLFRMGVWWGERPWAHW